MISNEIKNPAPAPQPKSDSFLRRLHDFDFRINKENIPKILPFMLYVAFWTIIYIANRHYGEKTVKEADSIRKEIPDLKADYYTINAELSNKSIQSEVVKMVDTLGLKELTTPPRRMKIVKDEER